MWLRVSAWAFAVVRKERAIMLKALPHGIL